MAFSLDLNSSGEGACDQADRLVGLTTEVMQFTEDGQRKMGFIDMKGLQLTVVRAIPLAGPPAEPGAYTVKGRVTDLVGQKSVEPVAQFTVVSR